MTFKGFEKPEQNYSKLPHSFIDVLPQIDTMAEMKVVLYLLRHTWGFSEFGKPKKLTTDEFCSGRKKRDQSRMDNGTGLSENSVRSGLEKAIEHGFILVEIDESDKARIEKWYCLNMENTSEFEPRGAKFEGLGAKFEERSEKETIERKEKDASASKPDLLDAEIHYNLKPTSIRQAIKEYFKLNVNWDTKTSRQWMEWAVGENVTPEQIERAADLWRKDKQFNWQVPTLKGIFEKWPMLTASNPVTPQTQYRSERLERSL